MYSCCLKVCGQLTVIFNKNTAFSGYRQQQHGFYEINQFGDKINTIVEHIEIHDNGFLNRRENTLTHSLEIRFDGIRVRVGRCSLDPRALYRRATPVFDDGFEECDGHGGRARGYRTNRRLGTKTMLIVQMAEHFIHKMHRDLFLNRAVCLRVITAADFVTNTCEAEHAPRNVWYACVRALGQSEYSLAIILLATF